MHALKITLVAMLTLFHVVSMPAVAGIGTSPGTPVAAAFTGR